MYIERAVNKHFDSLLKTFPAIVVTGARQVGKSTLLKHQLEGKADFVVFDPVIDIENARQDPELFFDNHKTPLVLDEVQYAPELLPVLKRRIDKDRSPGQYILTGSQQWGVLKSIAESLAGRAVFLDLEGFSLQESNGHANDRPWLHAWLDSPEQVVEQKTERLDCKYGVYESLWRGGLPDAYLMQRETVADYLMAYQRTYIERDARLLANVSDWQQFGRFMRLAAALTAQLINFSQLGREIGITPQTAERWLDILKATFQWLEVPAFSGNTIKRITNKPKGYIADTGIACWSLAISTPAAVASHPQWGAIFETAVYGEVRKAISLLSPRPHIYHWRTNAGAEVDLLLERDGIFYPIEIKASTNPSRSDTSGLKAFRNTYPQLKIAPGLVVCPCESFRKISDMDYAMPWDALASPHGDSKSRSH